MLRACATRRHTACMHMRLPAAKCSRRPRLRSQRAAVETRGRNGTTPLLVVHLRLRMAELCFWAKFGSASNTRTKASDPLMRTSTPSAVLEELARRLGPACFSSACGSTRRRLALWCSRSVTTTRCGGGRGSGQPPRTTHASHANDGCPITRAVSSSIRACRGSAARPPQS